MTTQQRHRSPRTRLRCETLEGRVTPAAVTVLDFGTGFTAGALPGGLPAGYAAGDLLLTDGPFQATAVWAPARVHVGSFRTSFVFRLDGEPGRLGDGFTFALRGTRPSGPGAAGGGLGYQGLTDSVAVKFDLVDNAGEGGHSVGVFTGGAEPTTPAVRLDDTPIYLHAQHPIRADLAYDGSVLTVTLTDLTFPDRTWTHDFPVDLPAALGGPTAFAGFTAGTGELFARQSIDSWTFAEVLPDVPASQPPTITVPAAVARVARDAVALTVQATDDGGDGGLTYTWEAVSVPPGAAAGVSAQLFDKRSAFGRIFEYGTYTYRVTVRDAEGLTATSEVSYTHSPSLSRFEIGPRQATVPAGGTMRFTAVGYDTYGLRLPAPIPVGWYIWQGPGTIDSTGLYTAPADVGGQVTIHAETGISDGVHFTPLKDEVTIQVLPPAPANRPPEIAAPISVSWLAPSSIALGALATDDGGTDALTYAWEVVSAPPGSAARLSPQASHPQGAFVNWDQYGHYVFRVTVTDAQGLAATRTVGFDPVLSNRDVHFPEPGFPVPGTIVFPQEATVAAGGTVQFGVDLRDRAGNRLPDPAPLWQVIAGPGTIDSSGLYTAPAGTTGEPWIQATVPDPSRPPAEWPTYVARAYIISVGPPAAGPLFGGGFAGADLAVNGSAGVAGDRLRLADAPFQAGSAFAPTPVDVRGFTTTFEFRLGDAADGRLGDGLTFVLQNAGPGAVGTAGGGLGYQGLADSVAVKFDLADNAGEGVDSVGVFTGGAEPTVPAAPLDLVGLQLHSGHVFRADLSYDAGTLVLHLWDRVTGQELVKTFTVDIPAAVGGSTAYAGFTAGTGELFAPIDVLDWTYVATTGAAGNTPPVLIDGRTPPPDTKYGRYMTFDALAKDDGGPFNLQYVWEVLSAPAGATPVRFEVNGVSSGHRSGENWDALATFDRAGEYVIRLTVRDRYGSATRTDPFRVVVAQEPWDFTVTPAAPIVPAGGTVGITVAGFDQFGDPLVGSTGGWHFVLEGPGFIDAANQYHAPADWGGVVTIRATNGTATGVTVVNVVRPASS